MSSYTNKLEDLIIETLSGITELSEFSPETRFDDYRLDSVDFSEIIYELEEKLSYPLTIPCDKDFKDVSEFAVYLSTRLPKEVLNDLDEYWI